MIYDFQAELHGTGSRSLHHNLKLDILYNLTLLLDAGIEASACARKSTTSTSTSSFVNRSYRSCDPRRTTAVVSYVRPAFVNRPSGV